MSCSLEREGINISRNLKGLKYLPEFDSAMLCILLMVLSERVIFPPKVRLLLSHTRLLSDTVWLKLIWQSPGVESRTDSVVMTGRKTMAVRERRRIKVLTKVDRLSRARSKEYSGIKTEGATKVVNREII